jgi:hypothetical protein
MAKAADETPAAKVRHPEAIAMDRISVELEKLSSDVSRRRVLDWACSVYAPAPDAPKE